MDRWLKHLSATPIEAFEALAFGRADVGVYSRASLGEVLIVADRTQKGALDAGARGFLEKHMHGTVPAWMTPRVWGSRLQDVFRGLTSLDLRLTNEFLREQQRNIRLWLGGYYDAPSLDPEAEYLRALAWAQIDSSLLSFWRRLALREEGKTSEWVEIGLLGLGKAKAPKGEVPDDVPSALIAAVIDLASLPETAEAWWIRKVRALRAAYGITEGDWRAKLEMTLKARLHASRAGEWLDRCFPKDVVQDRHPKKRVYQASAVPRPPQLAETDGVVDEVSRRGPHAMGGRIESFLERHRQYAEETGDGYYLVRSFHRLAEKARYRDADWALSVIDEALRWGQSNQYLWIAKAHCLEAAGDEDTALETLWAARIRLAHSDYVRTELGSLLRRGGDLEASRAVLDEARRDFPGNLAVRSMLAEVLIESNDIDEAVNAYREALQLNHKDVYVRDGLSKALIRRGYSDDLTEAERLLRQTKQLLRNDAVCRNTLAELLKDQGRFEEAVEVCREAANDFRHDVFSRSILGEVLFILSARKGGDLALKEESKRWLQDAAKMHDSSAQRRLATFEQRWQSAIARGGERIESAGVKDRETVARVRKFNRSENEWSPAQRLGRALLVQWQATLAHDSELRESLFRRAEWLLDISLTENDDYFAAIVEARGFLLLARGHAAEALRYFTEQVQLYGRAAWEGIRLGLVEARIRASQPVEAQDWRRLASAGPEGAITPLVVKVLNSLAQEGDNELRSNLAQLYPHAASRTTAHGRGKEQERASLQIESKPPADVFLADWIKVTWFDPAGIHSVDELDDPEKLAKLRETACRTSSELWQTVHNIPLALAA